MSALDDDRVDAVFSDAVSRASRSLRNLDRTAEQIVKENDADLHLIKEGFQPILGEEDPFRLLGVFTEVEAGLAQMRAREGLQTRIESDEDYRHCRAPPSFSRSHRRLCNLV